MKLTSRAGLAAVTTALLVSLANPYGASAEATSDKGLWYFEALNVGAAHAAGFTGEGVTIAVIDSPINTEIPTLQGADIEFGDPICFLDESGAEPVPATSTDLTGAYNASHGTNVVSYLVGTGKGYPGQTGVKGVAPGATVIAYAVPESDDPEREGQSACTRSDAAELDAPSKAFGEAVDDAIDRGADIISVSAGFVADPETDRAFSRAIREGVVIVGALSNSNEIAFVAEFPADGNGAVTVQAIDAEVNIQETDGVANRNSATDIVAPGVGILLQGEPGGDWKTQRTGRGTSYATPIVAGFLAVVTQKYPEATGNQLIQSLIHNTGRDDNTVVYDDTDHYGYGTASLTVMLEQDPTQYDDVNPLINDLQLPSREAIFADSAVDPTVPTVAPDEPTSISTVLIGVGIAVGALIFLAGVVVAIVLVRRRRRV